MRSTRLLLLLAGLGACSFKEGMFTNAVRDARDDAVIDLDDADTDVVVMLDASVDAMPDAMADAAPDAMPDARSCPSDYVTLTGGQAMSRYKRYGYATSAANAMTYAQARQTCATEGGYIAIPVNDAELGALEAVSQNNNAPGYWVGINDLATEGTWTTELGMTATYLPWKGPPNAQPNGGTAANCVVGSQNELWDVDCNLPYPFTCECSL